MDKTKKYTILFVVICFIGIGVGGLLNQPSSSNYKKNKEETSQTVSIQVNEKETKEDSQQTEKEETKKEKETKETTKKQEEKQTSNTTQEQKQEKTTSKESKQNSSSQSKQNETSKQEPVQETTQEVSQSQVTLSIQGVNGMIASETMTISDNDTAYSVLKTLCNQKGISLSTKGYGKIIYVAEINGLSEFDYGNMSGWKYKVNGVYPNVGAGAYTVKDGDRVEWVYTTEG